MSGIYHADSIKDAAESLGISNLSDGVAAMLACDLEYRLHQIIDEASRFTRHGKRTTLTTTDVDQAFRPVYGHSGLNAPSFKKAIPTVGAPVYALQDEEIDFDKVIKEEEIPVPRAVSWTAHWLAIEGVQPLIPENPSPTTTISTSATSKPRLAQPQANGATSPTQPQNNKAPLTTKSHLSRELQQYYARLTDSLLPGNLIETGSDRALDRKRTAALSSLRNDAGLQGILPYLVKWVGDSVMGALAIRSNPDDEIGDLEEDIDRRVLEVMLMEAFATIHPFPAGAAEGNFASFMSRPNAAQVNDAREQLTGYLGPFFATRVCQKSTQWGVGLAKALADRASAVGGTPGGTGGLASNLDNLALDAHRESGTAPMDVMSQAEGFALVEEPSSGMGMSLGMGGDLGGLGSEAMDAT
ncbi:hypothetical protein FRB90_003290 [Tulasnella sp. 427]|nr:hypothetical protein FRB90_003290 [Tulasnella sp. 427]